jgi:hypothetical protein
MYMDVSVVCRGVMSAGELFQQMTSLVLEQSETILRIEDDVEEGLTNTIEVSPLTTITVITHPPPLMSVLHCCWVRLTAAWRKCTPSPRATAGSS